MRRQIKKLGVLALIAALTLTSIPASAATDNTDYSYSFYFFEHEINMKVGETYDLGFYLDPYAFKTPIHIKTMNSTILGIDNVTDDNCVLHATDSFDEGEMKPDEPKTTEQPEATVKPETTEQPEATEQPDSNPDDDGDNPDDFTDDGNDFKLSAFHGKVNTGSLKHGKVNTGSLKHGEATDEDEDEDNSGFIDVGGTCKTIRIKAIYGTRVLDTVYVNVYDPEYKEPNSNDSEIDDNPGDEIKPTATPGPVRQEDEDSTNYVDGFNLSKKSFSLKYSKKGDTYTIKHPLSGETATAVKEGAKITAVPDSNAKKCISIKSSTATATTLTINGSGSGTITFNIEVDGRKKPMTTVSIKVTKKSTGGGSTGGGGGKKPAATPAQITGLKVKSVAGKKATLTWTKVAKNITGYQVYRSTKKSSDFKKIATIKASAAKYTNKNKKTVTYTNKVKKTGTFYYKVRAYHSASGRTTSYGKYSAVKSAKVTK